MRVYAHTRVYVHTQVCARVCARVVRASVRECERNLSACASVGASVCAHLSAWLWLWLCVLLWLWVSCGMCFAVVSFVLWYMRCLTLTCRAVSTMIPVKLPCHADWHADGFGFSVFDPNWQYAPLLLIDGWGGWVGRHTTG